MGGNLCFVISWISKREWKSSVSSQTHKEHDDENYKRRTGSTRDTSRAEKHAALGFEPETCRNDVWSKY